MLFPLLAAPADPFGLKTPWAAAFATVAADAYAVQDVAGLRASLGRGGHVRLAAGTYDLGAAEFAIYRPTVFEGAGEGKTVILVGGQYKEPGARVPGDDYGLKVFGDEVGFKNLTIRNASRARTPNGILRGGPSGRTNHRVFFDGVRIDEGNALAVFFDGLEDALMRDCEVTATEPTDGPLRLAGAKRLRMEGCRFLWRGGRVNLLYVEDSDVVGNTFTFDASHRSGGESGGLELSFASDLRFWDNRVTTRGRLPGGGNDAEAVMTQMSILSEYQGDGKVVAARGDVLATTMRWGDDPWFAPRSPATRRKALYVLSGRAAGQWRWAAPGAKDGAVTLDRPWAVPPAPGDRVSLGSVTAYRLDIRRNEVSGYRAGIELYDGALDCAVADNVVTNSGGIFLRSVSLRSERTPRSTHDHFPLWGTVVKRNRIVNDDGSRPASLDVYSTDLGNTGLPMPFYGVFVQDNRIAGRDQNFGGEAQWADGLLVGWNGTLGPVVPSRRGGLTASGNVLKGASIYVDRQRAASVP